jgi:hypothetical protein
MSNQVRICTFGLFGCLGWAKICNGTYLDRSSYLDMPYVQEGIAEEERKEDCCHEGVLQVTHRLRNNVGLGRVTKCPRSLYRQGPITKYGASKV